MTKKAYFRFLVFVITASVFVASLLLFFCSSPQVEVFKNEWPLMGTLWSVQIVRSPGVSQQQLLEGSNAVFNELSRIDALMSEWRKDSPLSLINSSAGREGVTVPPELKSILERGIAFGQESQGVFDITWLGIEPLWRFDDDFVPPTESAVAAALESVDFKRITIEGNKVSLPEGFAIGLGGIAKGYAIDQAAETLISYGFKDFLVNGGGDIRTAGRRGTRRWSVGVRNPRGVPNDLILKLSVSDSAVVTSGDYERFRLIDGVRYHHIIDPRTGHPASKCRSVTVVSKTAEKADILATALFVLGPTNGIPLAEKYSDTEVFIVDSEGKFWMSDGFSALAEFF